MIATMTRAVKLGLIGDNITRSKSPRLHVTAGQLTGLNVTYDRLIPHDMHLTLDEVFDQAQAKGYRGLNITYPDKELVTRRVTVTDPLHGHRDRRDHFLVAAHPGAHSVHHLGRKPGAMIKFLVAIKRGFLTVHRKHASKRPFRQGHDQGHIKPFRQPACQPGMIRMEMCDDDPVYPAPGHRTFKQDFPCGLNFIGADACIDNDPFVAIFQQPQVYGI